MWLKTIFVLLYWNGKKGNIKYQLVMSYLENFYYSLIFQHWSPNFSALPVSNSIVLPWEPGSRWYSVGHSISWGPHHLRCTDNRQSLMLPFVMLSSIATLPNALWSYQNVSSRSSCYYSSLVAIFAELRHHTFGLYRTRLMGSEKDTQIYWFLCIKL